LVPVLGLAAHSVSMKTRSAAFLFGSGISLLSKAPTVQTITKSLLDEKWTKNSTGSYSTRRPDAMPDRGEAEADQAQDFLKIVQSAIEDHLSTREGRPVNYEDLFSAAKQIFEDEAAEITNPLLAGSIATIKASSAYLYNRYSGAFDDNRFATLAKDSTDLIQSVVCQRLTAGIERQGLGIISAAAKAFGHVDVFSLNHDLLIEEELKQTQTTFTDGFGKRNGEMTEFSWAWDRSKAKVHLFKLHGSIN
jgi:hypothetical protein